MPGPLLKYPEQPRQLAQWLERQPSTEGLQAGLAISVVARQFSPGTALGGRLHPWLPAGNKVWEAANRYVSLTSVFPSVSPPLPAALSLYLKNKNNNK